MAEEDWTTGNVKHCSLCGQLSFTTDKSGLNGCCVVRRNLTVETGLLPQANGSSRLRLITGGTDVLAAVKAEVCEPTPGREKEGRLECSVECWSSASPQFEGKGAAEINAELTRTLSRYAAVGLFTRLASAAIS